MRKFLISVLVLFFMVLPVNAFAGKKPAKKSGWYISGTLGMASDTNVDDVDDRQISEPDGDRDYDADDGPDSGEYSGIETNVFNLSEIEFGTDNNMTGLIAIGKRIGKSTRIELEYGYRNSHINHWSANTSSYSQWDANGFAANEYAPEDEGGCDCASWWDGTEEDLAQAVEDTNTTARNDASTDRIGDDNAEDYLGDLNIHSLMVNVFRDFNHGSRFRPYVGGGLGAAWTNYEINRVYNSINITEVEEPDSDLDMNYEYDEESLDGDFIDETAFSLGYQFMAGIGFAVTEEVVLSAGYRLFGTTGEFDTTIHAAEVGVRYHF